jgi:hypothetical protein
MADYIIRSFDAVNGSIVVDYQGVVFNLDLPVENGRYPEGAELDAHITMYLPVWVIERKNLLAQGVENEASIASLVQPFPEPPIVELNLPATQPISEGTQNL